MLHRNKTAEFADMHCHILPGVDDGAGNRQEAMKMLEIAFCAGVTHMIVTPHYKEGHHNASPAIINKLVLSLQNEAAEAGIPISLFAGNEIFYFQEIADRLERNEICTLNDTEYVLVEFMPSDSFTTIRNGVNHLVSMGYIPIVAHVERYACMLKHKEAVEELHGLGGEIQINIASIEGRMGYAVKHFTHCLLTRKQIDYLGTDAHDSRKRTPDVKACMSRLYRKYDRDYIERVADRIVYTGMIDAYYDYCFGELEYRSLRFETEVLDTENYQENAVVNYTEYEIPYTRIIEHKHFEFQCQNGTDNPKTVITREYPHMWSHGDEPYYPMNDERNNAIYEQYRSLAEKEKKVIFGGRLGLYRYFDMHQVVEAALKCVEDTMA